MGRPVTTMTYRVHRCAASFLLALAGGSVSACSDSSTSVAKDGPLGESCDPSVVLCESPPPQCLAEELPATSGTCWAGYCVKASDCRSVKDCTACEPNRYACTTYGFPAWSHVRCVEIPIGCELDRSCACLAPFICPNFTCSVRDDGYMCECPNC